MWSFSRGSQQYKILLDWASIDHPIEDLKMKIFLYIKNSQLSVSISCCRRKTTRQQQHISSIQEELETLWSKGLGLVGLNNLLPKASKWVELIIGSILRMRDEEDERVWRSLKVIFFFGQIPFIYQPNEKVH